MHHIRYNLIMARHYLADAVTGAQALAILPCMLVLCYFVGGELPFLLASIIVPTLVILCAYYDHRLRCGLTRSNALEGRVMGKTFEGAVDNALYRCRLRGGTVLCLVMELKPVNPPADGITAEVLEDRRASRLLRRVLRRRDYLCALGGNRFGIIISQSENMSSKEAFGLALRLRNEIEGQKPDQTAVIGLVSATGAQGLRGADLTEHAMRALDQARSLQIPQIQLARPDLRQGAERTSEMGKDIERAIAEGEFVGWFQPQICARTGLVTGFETLARWQHPTKGVILPGKFLGYLQQRGLMRHLHERMLSQALDGLQAWSTCPGPAPAVGLNVSPDDLSDPSLPDRIAWELDRRNLPPERLNIEVLETVVSTTPGDVTAQNIKRLSDLGCRIDLDDFGTGHASISSLQNFTLHRLKIDQSFVRNIDTDPAQSKLVAAILTMAAQLGLETLAEGVETQGEADHLGYLGCQQLQGYGIARPMPLEDSVAWLSKVREDRLMTGDHNHVTAS